MVCLAEHLSADRHFVMGGGDLPEDAEKRCRAPASEEQMVLCDNFLRIHNTPNFLTVGLARLKRDQV